MTRWFWGVGWGILGVVLAVAVRAQEPAATGASAADLAARYHFQERYTTAGLDADAKAEKPGADETIRAYEVAFRETIRSIEDTAQAAPRISEQTYQVKYLEQPAEVSSLDSRMVTAAVRHYDVVRIEPAASGKPGLFQDLTIWYQTRENDPPLVLTVTANRQLDAREYLLASRQVFVPSLSFALPERSLRVGDSYSLSKRGADALMGRPVVKGTLTGKLQQIQNDPAHPGHQIATLDISGSVQIGLAQSGVRAQLLFRFATLPDTTPTKAVIDAPGQISRLRLAQEVSGPMAPKSRLLRRMRRELVLECRPAESSKAPAVPAPPPKPTPENAWLVYEDAQKHCTLKYPQEYQLSPGQPDADSITLEHPTVRDPDLITVSLRHRSALDPEKLRSGRFAAWKEDGVEAVAGKAAWLPEAGWQGRKVYHFQAALPMADSENTTGTKPRVQFDGYVLLTGLDLGLYVEANTAQENPESIAQFRSQVEQMLKTFHLPGESGTAATKSAKP